MTDHSDGTGSTQSQLIELDGCLNFRDLGGYRTADGRRLRSGQLFRSDALHLLSAADVQYLRDRLGVRAIVDLRSSAELRAEGIGPLAEAPVRHHHLPIYDGDRSAEAPEEVPRDLGQRYFLMLRFTSKRIVEILELLAHTEQPAVFHCAAGKDRTGVVAALLLDLLGVEEAQIVADYAATSRNLPAIAERLHASQGYREILQELPADTLHAEPSTMRDLLARARAEWGSLAEFARASGLGAASIERLRARMLR